MTFKFGDKVTWKRFKAVVVSTRVKSIFDEEKIRINIVCKKPGKSVGFGFSGVDSGIIFCIRVESSELKRGWGKTR